MQLFIYSAAGNIIGLITKPIDYTDIHKIFLKYPRIEQLLYKKEGILRIYNCDGSEAYQCGNGLRAWAYHFDQMHYAIKLQRSMHTLKKIQESFWVDLGEPAFLSSLDLRLDHWVVDIGNKHLILEHKAELDTVSAFKEDFNISFISIQRSRIKIRTYERGAGWTNACGSAACAAVHVARQKYPTDDWEVISNGGTLKVTVINNSYWQTGIVTLVSAHELL